MSDEEGTNILNEWMENNALIRMKKKKDKEDKEQRERDEKMRKEIEAEMAASQTTIDGTQNNGDNSNQNNGSNNDSNSTTIATNNSTSTQVTTPNITAIPTPTINSTITVSTAVSKFKKRLSTTNTATTTNPPVPSEPEPEKPLPRRLLAVQCQQLSDTVTVLSGLKSRLIAMEEGADWVKVSNW